MRIPRTTLNMWTDERHCVSKPSFGSHHKKPGYAQFACYFLSFLFFFGFFLASSFVWLRLETSIFFVCFSCWGGGKVRSVTSLKAATLTW